MNIDTSSAEKFYNSYHQYFIDNININITSDKKYKFVFYCRENDETYCLEGSSMEEIYYKILFKIDYNCCDDIYVYLGNEYSIDVLSNPIELLKSHYFDNDIYICKEVNIIKSELNKEMVCSKVKININNSVDFYETFRQYYLSKIKIKPSNIKYQYILINKDCGEVFILEGYSMEELYYIVFFKIDSKLWDNIYDMEYPMEELKKPIELFKKHYLDSKDYIFEPIKFI
jgi:hypothetical protein